MKKRNYWLSFYEKVRTFNPPADPPNSIVGWWGLNGFREANKNGWIVVAVWVIAENKNDAMRTVNEAWPASGQRDLRFCKLKIDGDLEPKFFIHPWMESRIDRARREMVVGTGLWHGDSSTIAPSPAGGEKP